MTTIRTYVEVDVGDVLDEMTDEDLREELESRGASLPFAHGVGDSFMRDVEEAARTGRAFDLLAIVQAALPPLRSPCNATPYESLQRDPDSGRPVIQ